MKLDIEIEGLKKLQKQLDDVGRKQLPYATAKAINDTANDAKKSLVANMKSVFNKPTTTTLKSIIILYAKKSSLFANIKIKDKPFSGGGKSPADYLRPQIFGGTRDKKRGEELLKSYYVPGQGVELNKYGNISRGRIQQILSATRRQFDPYQRSTARSKKRNPNVRNIFQIRRTSRRGKHLHPGVYERKGERLKPLLILFDKRPRYTARFRFYAIVQKIVAMKYDRNFHKAFEHAMRTAKR